jgi:hypothetical protein
MERTPITDTLIRGALEVTATEVGVAVHRVSAQALVQSPDPQLAMAQSQPSGVRVTFDSAAEVVELETVPTKRVYVGGTPRPDGSYDLVVDGQYVARGTVPGGHVLTIDARTGASELSAGSPGIVRFAGLGPGRKTIEIWLPHDETTELVALHTDAPVEPASPDQRPVWLHHGSSISHGSGAEGPTGTWPAVAARHRGVQLVNLGLGGSALLDPCIARLMRDTAADLVSVKIGINLVNTDLMRARAFTPAVHGFLDTIRDGHPDTPLLVVSPILCPIHEDTPGPTAMNLDALGEGRLLFEAMGEATLGASAKLTLTLIRDELSRIVAERAASDPQLTYLDGRELYGDADVERLPLPDALHPDAETQRLIGERFASRAPLFSGLRG